MKKIQAVIQPHKVEDVRLALVEKEIVGITLSNVNGYGRQKGHSELYRGAEYDVDFVVKNLLEIVVDDSDVDAVIETIKENASTGSIGDGKIFVTNLENVIRIRTGETGSEAI